MIGQQFGMKIDVFDTLVMYPVEKLSVVYSAFAGFDLDEYRLNFDVGNLARRLYDRWLVFHGDLGIFLAEEYECAASGRTDNQKADENK